jgi:hypothetical protein
MGDCVEKCEAISNDCIGAFFSKCDQEYERMLAAGVDDPGFECNTLKEVAGPDGCSAASKTQNGWWCDTLAEGEGTMGQGWKRKCDNMCLMYQQNMPKTGGAASTAASGLVLALLAVLA